ncbi:MAG: CHAD domain-containing protein [Candidatus Sumerlaeaceae bacterium]|nr:CHAD domain-containing protein [Candidatus Sumerlaeaceae bacterium]
MTASKTARPPRSPKTTPLGASVDYGVLLAGRAREFLRWVEVILTKAEPSPDDVHDARVAGRRLIAALRFFEPLLRRRRTRRLRRAVRAAIGALGDFRDADILVGLLERAGKPEPSPPIKQAERADPPDPSTAPNILAAAILALQAGRDEAAARSREDFKAALPHTVIRGLQRLSNRGLPRRFNRPPWPDLLPYFAALQLQRVTHEFAALAATMNRNSPPDDLHRLRIVGKRLRYSVEIALPPLPAHSLLKTLRDLQDMLGTLHDLDVAIEYVDALARGGAPSASVFDPPRPPGTPATDQRVANAAARLRADRAALHARFLRVWSRRRFETLARRITEAAAQSQILAPAMGKVIADRDHR